MSVQEAKAADMIVEQEQRLRSKVAAAAEEFVQSTGLRVTGIEVEFVDTSTYSETSSLIGEVHVRWAV